MEMVHSRAAQVVLFATPSFDKSVSVDFHTSMLDTQTECVRHGISYGHRVRTGLQFIDLSRNELVDYFLRTPEYTDLFFIDADQGWDAKAIIRMLSYPQGVVCALPPKKRDLPSFHSANLRIF